MILFPDLPLCPSPGCRGWLGSAGSHWPHSKGTRCCLMPLFSCCSNGTRFSIRILGQEQAYLAHVGLSFKPLINTPEIPVLLLDRGLPCPRFKSEGRRDVNKLQALVWINKKMGRGCSPVTAWWISRALPWCVWIMGELNQAKPCNYYCEWRLRAI